MKKHFRQENQNYLSSIFKVWKGECQGAKRLTLGVNRIFQRNLVHTAFQEIVNLVKNMDSQLKSEYMCADILLKKARNCMKDCMIIWRCNMRKLQCVKMEKEAEEIVQKKEILKNECQEISHFIS